MNTLYRNHLSPPIFPHTWASEWGEDQHGLWQAFTYNGVRHACRWIPPGTFMMGSPDTEKGRVSSRETLHPVTLSKGFWLAETTVTQALWRAVMGENPSHFKGELLPVENVNWHDAHTFLEQFNQIDPSLSARLPTEAEWEYACRAGTQTPFNFGTELSLDNVNYRGTWEYKENEWGEGAKKATTEVGSYPCNDWGLYDMHGNVWEWCQDAWQEKFSASPITDPLVEGDSAGAGRVVRGGSWLSFGGYCRSAARAGSGPDDRGNGVGFRLVLGL